MKQIGKFENYTGASIHLAFDHEHDVLLDVSGDEGAKWISRIRRFGPYPVLAWVGITCEPVPSDLGIMVWSLEGCYRLGEMAMLVKPQWNNKVTVIWLKSERQKAWLHGFNIPTQRGPVTPQNMETLGRETHSI